VSVDERPNHGGAHPSLDAGKEWRGRRGIPIIPALDGYRGLAIIGVVLFHVLQVSRVFNAAGDSAFGVLLWGILPRTLDALFMVSGFVIYLPTVARGGDFGRVSTFAIRRAARLVPAYWLSLAIALLLLATVTPSPGIPSVGVILAHLAILQTPALLVVNHFPLGFGVVPPVWTLSVEVGFYVVLPLVAVAYFRHPLIGLAAAAAIVVAWHVAANNADAIAGLFGTDLSEAAKNRISLYYGSQFPSWALAIAAGMTGAWAYVRLRDRLPPALLERRATAATAAALAVLGLFIYLAGHDAVTDPSPFNGLFARQSLLVALGYPLALGAVLIGITLMPARLQRPATAPAVRWTGDISYAIYLIHFAVIWFALRELSLPEDGTAWAALTWCALVYPVSIAYAYLSARFLERPVRRWAHRFGRSGAAPADTAPPSPAATPARPGASAQPRPPVSIVIPTHNREAWLPGAMDSVLSQDYPDLELLVLDDGSTDGTSKLLADYAQRLDAERFRFERHENMGQGRTLNRGYDLARGEILGYLSDDDELAPEAISRLVQELTADPEAVVAYPGYRMIDAEGEIVDTIRPIEYSSVEALRLHDTIIGPGGLMRRAALESAGGWDPGMRWMGDLLLWMGIGLQGRAVRVPEPLASWRRHPGATTVQVGLEHAREHVRLVDQGLAMLELGPDATAVHAEALRNACILAAFFGGSAPGDRFASIDLQRPQISAFGAGLDPRDLLDGRAVEAAGLWRELARQTEELARLRSGAGPAGETDAPGSGVRAARRRLREIGALADDRGRFADGAGSDDLGGGLMLAALDCSADCDPDTSRFLLIDRDAGGVRDEEVAELVRLAFHGTLNQLQAALGRRREEAGRLRA
jgi:peptidoglycan/LPS O-acetylase OafA/YrhL